MLPIVQAEGDLGGSGIIRILHAGGLLRHQSGGS